MTRHLLTLAAWMLVASVCIGILGWLAASALDDGPTAFGVFTFCCALGWFSWEFVQTWRGGRT